MSSSISELHQDQAFPRNPGNQMPRTESQHRWPSDRGSGSSWAARIVATAVAGIVGVLVSAGIWVAWNGRELTQAPAAIVQIRDDITAYKKAQAEEKHDRDLRFQRFLDASESAERRLIDRDRRIDEKFEEIKKQLELVAAIVRNNGRASTDR